MKTKEVADLTGISVRTLHHYDNIGLVSPERKIDNEYREYTNADLARLQQILFFKKLGFKLSIIKEIINNPDYDQEEALLMQKEMLIKEQFQMSVMINTIDETLKNMRGGMEMPNEEKFKGVDFSKNPYEREARERWGDDAVNRSNEKLKQMDKKDTENRFKEIMTDLAAIRHMEPDSEVSQEEIGRWYDLLNEMGEYTPEMFKNLGDMYVEDERFTKNIDQYGSGLADFMKRAMNEYYEQHK